MENPPLSPITPVTPQKQSGCGCFGTGCIIALVVLLIAGAIGIGFGMWIFNSLKAYTSDKPIDIPTVQATDAEYEAVKQKLKSFKQAANTGQASMIQLTDREINILIAKDPDFAEAKGHVYVEIADGTMHAKVSIPLDWLPLFNGRFLNGDVKCKPNAEGGMARINIQEIKVGDKTAPAEFLKSFEDGFNRSFNEGENTQKVMERIKSVQIINNTILIETKPGPAALPEGSATPSPVEQ